MFGLGWTLGLAATSVPVKEFSLTFQILFSIFVGAQERRVIFYVSAVRRRTSAAKRAPSARNFAAEVYTPPRRDKDSTPVTPLSAITSLEFRFAAEDF